ncbi:hypothetical protein D3C75_1057410 [compost metagenome]
MAHLLEQGFKGQGMFGQATAQGTAAHVQVAGNFLEMAALGQIARNGPLHGLNQVDFLMHLGTFQLQQRDRLA